MSDKFQAVWVSHSSISDFLKCPRLYYLNNIYKDPVTNHKIQIMTPSLALGQIVHEVLESLSVIKTENRFKSSLIEIFDNKWRKVSGERGGFFSNSVEKTYQDRGRKMLQRVMNNPGPVARLAVKIKQDLPNYWLSEEDGIILCGKIDWLEYLPDTDSVKILDFKTSKRKEEGSLQLPIYHLLVKNTQERNVVGASYWYLELEDEPEDKELPDLDQSHAEILQIAKRIKLQRQLGKLACKNGPQGCKHCYNLEQIVKGKGKKVGESSYHQDIYILKSAQDTESEIL